MESLKETLLELLDLGGLDLIKVSTDTAEKNASLLFNGHGHILLLLEELSELLTTVKKLLGGSIKIGTELSEGSDLTILGKLELQGTGELLHGLNLGSRSDTGDGKTDVNGGADTLMEELGLKEDLSISNGDDIGWDIGGHITGLGLNDWESSEGSSTVVLVQLSCALEETGMEIEDITWVSLTTGGTTEKKRHLSVGNSLLGEIVIDDKSVSGGVSEELTNGASGVRSQELERSSIGGSSSNDDSVLEAISFLKETHDVGDGGSLLTDSDVDAVEGLGVVTGFEDSLLVDDGINSNSGLANLSITNDQFTLTSANWDLFVHNQIV